VNAGLGPTRFVLAQRRDLGYNDRVKKADAKTDLLSSSALFSSFSRDELGFLAEKSEFLSLEDGGTVFEPGSPGDRLYLVASGSVLVFSPEDGSVLAEFVKGDSFGELELLNSSSRNASAKAEGPTSLLCFPAHGAPLKEVLSARPAVAARILRSFLLVVAGRTRKANALVKENSPLVRELKRQVYGDKLTGLYNKAYLEESLPKMLSSAGAAGSASAACSDGSDRACLALLMMKPDNFKEINDRFGHEAGDASLVLMASELARAVALEPRGTAVRYMGNELAAIYPGLGRAAARAAAKAIQDRLGALDLSPLGVEAGLRLSMSIGIVVSPEHGSDAEELIKLAAGLPLVGRARGGSLILFPEDAE
jgi:diguanylate cyclase